MFSLTLGLSIILVGAILAVGLTGSRPRYGEAMALAFASLFFCGLSTGSAVLALIAVSVVVIGFCCSLFGLRRRWFCGGVLAATVGSYAVVIGTITMPYMQKAAELKEQYPFVVLDTRLAYETRTAADSRTEPTMTARTLESLSEMEKQLEAGLGRNARYSLQRIHRSQVQHFVGSPGFGIGRMSRSLRAPKPDPDRGEGPIPLPPGDYEDPALSPLYGDPWGTSESLPAARLPARDVFWKAHQDGVLDFASQDSFGYVRSRREAAGFQPHGFSSFPVLPAGSHEHWTIRDLALVSLLKHEQPMVYLTDKLPRMEELRAVNAPVRPLDEVEKRMIAPLQQGEEVQVLLAGDRIRMMGSIRAAKQCLECHEVQRGELLGAFSYKLRRE